MVYESVLLYVCMDYSMCMYVNTHTYVHTKLVFLIIQDSLDSVEELLKKHEDFEKLLAAQEERFTQLNRETQVTA